MKKIRLLIIICCVIAAQLMAEESLIPQWVPDIRTSIPAHSDESGYITLNEATDDDFAQIAFFPLIKRFVPNSSGYEAGNVYSTQVFNTSLIIKIEKENDTFIFRGRLSNNAFYFTLKINEAFTDFSYYQVAAAKIHSSQPQMNSKLMVYCSVPSGSISDIGQFAFHSRMISMIAIGAFSSDNPLHTSFAAGEIYSDNSINGCILYDIRELSNPSCTLGIANLNVFLSSIKNNFQNEAAWTTANIDPEGSTDKAPSYLCFIFDKAEQKMFSSKNFETTYSALQDIECIWKEKDNPRNVLVKDLPWNLFAGETYSRAGLVNGMSNEFEMNN